MSQKVRVELNHSGIEALLKGAEVQEYVSGIASAKAQALGKGYAYDVYVAPTRAISSVYTETSEAYRDNLQNNTLLKAIGK